MRQIIFDVDPIAKGRPRFSTRGSFARAYTPKRTKDFESLIQEIAQYSWKGEPETGLLGIKLEFFLPIKQKKLWDQPHGKKPDVDNLCKGVLDALNGICWVDDGQIAMLETYKSYAREGKIILTVYRIITPPNTSWVFANAGQIMNRASQ